MHRLGTDAKKIAMILRTSHIATRFGLRRVDTFGEGELVAAVDAIGSPTDFPLSDWPGVTVSTIA
jgi:hypothetical protein